METGVDIVVRMKDETVDGSAQIQSSLSRFGELVKQAGANMTDEIGRGLMRRVERSLIDAIDAAMESIDEAMAKSMSFTEVADNFAESIVTSLRKIPVAGALGSIMARAGALLWTGDPRTDEQRAEALEQERKANLAAAQAEADLVSKLEQDKLTDAEKRRKAFDEDAGRILGKIEDVQTRNATRDRLAAAFREREARIAQEAADELAAKDAEQTQKNAAAMEREAERLRKDQERDAEALARRKQREEERTAEYLHRAEVESERAIADEAEERDREALRRAEKLADARGRTTGAFISRTSSAQAQVFRASEDEIARRERAETAQAQRDRELQRAIAQGARHTEHLDLMVGDFLTNGAIELAF